MSLITKFLYSVLTISPFILMCEVIDFVETVKVKQLLYIYRPIYIKGYYLISMIGFLIEYE